MRGTLAQLVAAIPGARLVGGDAAFEGVSTDSRTAPAGALFVALKGATFDAHSFLGQVAGRGVAAAVINENAVHALPEGWTLPAIVVPDTLVALGCIANVWRTQHDIPVIGVTGSNGKTTVKEMIASILAVAVGEDARLATQGNLNNEIGVPLTLFRLGKAHRAAVIEMGMNHPGEIARLAAIAAPTVAMVNNAQREHQEFMHTVEAVARENGSVLQALPSDGVAVFPGDDTYTDLWRSMAKCEVLTFGLTNECNVSASYTSNGFGSQLRITTSSRRRPGSNFDAQSTADAVSATDGNLDPGLRRDDGSSDNGQNIVSVTLQAAGEHNVRNALAAIASTLAAGIPVEAIVRGLESFAPVGGRLQRKQAAGGATVIDDTYNANPDSMRAAIDVLAAYDAPRILVVGDMGEVGTQGKEFHEEVGAYAQARGIEHVLATGELARHMTASGARHYEQFDELLAALDSTLGGNRKATVLVKGSRFMKMERAVQHLTGSTMSKDAH
ncbi:UDP-N-acetylmuramoyl-tripeptide--D-alanyl-D-alanine ligase [Massilia sp. LC238]|uniref:UDP-N-acetylmuramoyl-tripeptide--D-alanyl-D- alanine ligase n=1 Tax=Massilia sp. LC238 TaxID=1502852 RepID=UPI0004E2C4B7|nr:Mur ligase family protein [Massilia sp. LC238]KFC72107.1 UDP-N-acetylmuramoyl-tripeptide--D-alanyl-D-alanine ligase [Massilia sp. LC238]